MKLTLGFSPCPNDCFIFDAMIHGKVDTEGLEFDVIISDVEELNKCVIPAFGKQEGKFDITKLSYAAYAFAANDYNLLNSGSALGFGVGPLLISKKNILCSSNQISDLKIAIPGKYTTANLLFTLAFPNAKNKIEMLFSDIENALLNRKADAGIIIHENRFTYEQKGLIKLLDLGEWWQKQTGHAIPLGGIAIKRNLPDKLKYKVNGIIRKSVEFAFANPESCLDFVKQNAQEMSEDVIYKHIDLYVNNFSIDLGKDGKKAVTILLKKAMDTGLIKDLNMEVFI